MNKASPSALNTAPKKKNIVRAQKRFLILFTALVLALLFFLFLVDQFFVVRRITVTSQSPFYTEEEIVTATGIYVGEKMFAFSEEETRLEMLRKLSYFSNARIRKKFPSEVEISFEEIPGTMYVDVYEEHYILAPDFSVIARASEEDLAVQTRMHVITTDVTRCVVGEKLILRDETHMALLEKIYAALSAEGLAEQVEYLDATNRFHITLNCSGRWEVDLGDSSELEYKVKMISGVIASADEEYGPSAGGKIDVTGVREAIVQLYTEQGAQS